MRRIVTRTETHAELIIILAPMKDTGTRKGRTGSDANRDCLCSDRTRKVRLKQGHRINNNINRRGRDRGRMMRAGTGLELYRGKGT